MRFRYLTETSWLVCCAVFNHELVEKRSSPHMSVSSKPMLVTLVLSKWDLPVCSNMSTLSGVNPHLIIQEAPGSKLQVSIGKMGTSTTTKGRTMKKPQVGIRRDECPSLAEGIMTLRRPSIVSTTGSQPLKRTQLPYKVSYIVIHNGKLLWDTRWPVSNSNSDNRTRSRTLCSRTSTYHIRPPC
jgi:hypothetical protein